MNNNNNNKLVGIGQLTTVGNIEKNYQNCKKIIEKGANLGCKLVCLPECFAFIGTSFQETIGKAEPLDGPLFTKYKQLAKENDVWISYGGFHEKKLDHSEKIFNSHVIVDNSGEIKAVYRKNHLFSVDLSPNGPKLDENQLAERGKDIVLCDSPIGKLGLTICYDVRFPELNIILRQAGADIILVPSAFTKETGRDHWNTLLKSTAIYTQTYVLASAQYGNHNEKRASFGRSLVCDPWGLEVAQASDISPSLILAEIDDQILERTRKNLPCFDHRRTDLYGNLYELNKDKVIFK